MKFEEVLPALREGKKVRRKDYPSDYYICLKDKVLKAFISYFNGFVGEIKLITRDLLADDWEIIKESKKVKIKDMTVAEFISFKNQQFENNEPFKSKLICPACLSYSEFIRGRNCWLDSNILETEVEIEEE